MPRRPRNPTATIRDRRDEGRGWQATVRYPDTGQALRLETARRRQSVSERDVVAVYSAGLLVKRQPVVMIISSKSSTTQEKTRTT